MADMVVLLAVVVDGMHSDKKSFLKSNTSSFVHYYDISYLAESQYIPR
jgi:hypothetical protein